MDCAGSINGYTIGKWLDPNTTGALTLDGQEHCKTTNYISKTVITNQTITGCDIYSRDVTVTNNKKLILEALDEVTIDGNFEIGVGSELEIK